ncbi:MAG TPA: L-histidine N(alpha)-methyltransferase [Candidatus Saccharimonadales bacterium]|nr:L-histidine N(alpha)-methyltransferase [Candidatus Saccharimonadales bacterium]
MSVRTVRNWIEAAKQGKLDLDLHSQGNKTYVSNTSRNLSTIEQLVERGKKYRPHRAVKTVTPKPEFYELFNDAQIYDIIRSIEIYSEIPHQYSYFNGGARHFDEYAQRMATEETPNTLTSTVLLIERNQSYFDELLNKYSRINIIDVGVGNGLPVRSLIDHLKKAGKMGRYIGLDISPEMLGIAHKNIKKWFGGKPLFEGYEIDINYERFSNIVASEYLSEHSSSTANIILFLGGTLSNLREPERAFKAIRDSMGAHDILIHSQKLDSPLSRRYFDFNSENGFAQSPTLAPIHKFIVDMMGIDKAFYDIEMGYDDIRRERHISIRFNVALSLELSFADGGRMLNFNKGDNILLWRARQSSALDVVGLLDSCGLYTLQSSQTEDQEYLLTVSQIKHG